MDSELKQELQEAIGLIVDRCPQRFGEALNLRKAITVNSPIVGKRFAWLLRNACEEGGFSQEETRRFQRVLSRIEDREPLAWFNLAQLPDTPQNRALKQLVKQAALARGQDLHDYLIAVLSAAVAKG